MLNIGNGLKEYDLNGVVKIRFNPTDVHFIEKIFEVFDKLDERQNEYSKRLQSNEEPKKLFEIAREMDAETREIIDVALGEKVCDPLFGNISIYAGDGDGLPLWANLLLTIISEMDDSFTREKKATNPRIQRYVAKFKK